MNQNDQQAAITPTDHLPQSPRPARNTTTHTQMDFLYALRLVRDDSAHITRLSWNNVSIYGLMRNGTLMLHKDDEQFYQWIVNDGDMAAKDWCVL